MPTHTQDCVARDGAASLVQAEPGSETAKSPLDESCVEFDEEKINRIVNDIRDDARLDTRCAIPDRYI
jgi:hypothetical protein